MRNTYEIAKNEIKKQIEGKIYVLAIFTDIEPEIMSLYDQGQTHCFLEPSFCRPHRLERKFYEEILSMKIGEDFDDDLGEIIIIETKMSYDQFFEKYYNFKAIRYPGHV